MTCEDASNTSMNFGWMDRNFAFITMAEVNCCQPGLVDCAVARKIRSEGATEVYHGCHVIYGP